jgi:hypothetical protein
VELGGFGKLHAPFFTERRTRSLVRCRVAGNPGPGWADIWQSAPSTGSGQALRASKPRPLPRKTFPGNVFRQSSGANRLGDLGFQSDFALAAGKKIANAANLCAYPAELFFDPLVPPIDMVDAIEDGLAIGH